MNGSLLQAFGLWRKWAQKFGVAQGHREAINILALEDLSVKSPGEVRELFI